jgi:hypothetical protein
MSIMTKLKSSRGADEANVDGVSHPRHSDGFFYVPEDVAQRLTSAGAGFYRAAHDDHPEAGSTSLAEAGDVIFGLDPSPIRDALIATIKPSLETSK